MVKIGCEHDPVQNTLLKLFNISTISRNKAKPSSKRPIAATRTSHTFHTKVAHAHREELETMFLGLPECDGHMLQRMTKLLATPFTAGNVTVK